MINEKSYLITRIENMRPDRHGIGTEYYAGYVEALAHVIRLIEKDFTVPGCGDYWIIEDENRSKQLGQISRITSTSIFSYKICGSEQEKTGGKLISKVDL